MMAEHFLLKTAIEGTLSPVVGPRYFPGRVGVNQKGINPKYYSHRQ
jgi:hypothetical protein